MIDMGNFLIGTIVVGLLAAAVGATLYFVLAKRAP